LNPGTGEGAKRETTKDLKEIHRQTVHSAGEKGGIVSRLKASNQSVSLRIVLKLRLETSIVWGVRVVVKANYESEPREYRMAFVALPHQWGRKKYFFGQESTSSSYSQKAEKAN